MTVYYFDPDYGLDTNDGLTFATRKKSCDGLTPASGDEYRYMAARSPHSLGNATWTVGSNTIALATAKNVTIDNCDAQWTAVTGVSGLTTSTQTPSTSVTLDGGLGNFYPKFSGPSRIWKQGTAVGQVVVPAAFTTGLICYKTLDTPLDLSAYTAVSMKFYHSGAIVTGSLRLDLCSDNAGATPVASMILPVSTATGIGYNLFMENGSALPSNVNSVALYAVTDPSTAALTIQFDNIIACQSRGHADHLCHDSMIGKETTGEPEMWPIRSIDGANIVIGSPETTGSVTGRLYAGVSETITTYAQQTQVLMKTQSLSGSTGTAVLITGGWDRESMTTQTGETFLSGRLSCSHAFDRNNPNFDIRKISYTGFIEGIVDYTTGMANGFAVQGKHASGNCLVVQNASCIRGLNIDYMVMNGAFGSSSNNNGYNSAFRIQSKLWGECNLANYGFWMSYYNVTLMAPNQIDVKIDKIRNNLVGYGGGNQQSFSVLRDAVFTLNGADLQTSTYVANMRLSNCAFNRTIGSGGFNGVGANSGSLIYTKRNGDDRLNGFANYMISCETQTSVVPATGDTYAWCFESVGFNVTEDHWPTYPIARLAVKAGQAYSLQIDGRRTNTNITGRLSVIKTDGSEAGIDIDGTANTWGTYSFGFTASTDGVVDILIGEKGNISGAYRCYFANFKIAYG